MSGRAARSLLEKLSSVPSYCPHHGGGEATPIKVAKLSSTSSTRGRQNNLRSLLQQEYWRRRKNVLGLGLLMWEALSICFSHSGPSLSVSLPYLSLSHFYSSPSLSPLSLWFYYLIIYSFSSSFVRPHVPIFFSVSPSNLLSLSLLCLITSIQSNSKTGLGLIWNNLYNIANSLLSEKFFLEIWLQIPQTTHSRWFLQLCVLVEE